MSKNVPLVSVLMPAYNHSQYIEEAINSILNQSYKNIEMIIIDDGSSDNTFEIISSLKDKCKKRFVSFKCFTQANQGTSYTLRKLVSLSKGDYFYLIASDDVAYELAIETLVTEAIKNDYVLVVGDNALIDANSKQIGWDEKQNIINLKDAKFKTFASYLTWSHSEIKNFSSNDFGSYSSLLKGNYIPNGYLINKKAYDKTGGYTEQKMIEDYYLNLQLSKIGKFKYINQILFYYRWHSSNSIKKKQIMLNLEEKTYEIELKNIKDSKFEKVFFDSTLIYKKNFLCFGKNIKVEKYKYRFGKFFVITLYSKKFCLFKSFSFDIRH